jgi:hypothetical protein
MTQDPPRNPSDAAESSRVASLANGTALGIKD